MRIIGGEWRSRKLVRPGTSDTRPMPDRVKAAVFSMLGARYECPGALPPILVADVFAGSGSMGLEALSRGARFCSLFERSPVAIRAIERNVEAVDAGARVEIVRRDAWRAATETCEGEPFDLVFLDPPYRDSADVSARGPVRRYLARLAELDAEPPVIVLHHFAKIRFALEANDVWCIADVRRFGSNAVTVFMGH